MLVSIHKAPSSRPSHLLNRFGATRAVRQPSSSLSLLRLLLMLLATIEIGRAVHIDRESAAATGRRAISWRARDPATPRPRPKEPRQHDAVDRHIMQPHDASR
jgi:hypothetical protein